MRHSTENWCELAEGPCGRTRDATICDCEHASIALNRPPDVHALLSTISRPQRFSHAEQAELVAQFLYCIPLATVERVLTWLRPLVPREEAAQLLTHLQAGAHSSVRVFSLLRWFSCAMRAPRCSC